MAREAYRSLYGDLRKLKDNSLLDDPAAGNGDDDELFELLLAVFTWVDAYCNRHFYPPHRRTPVRRDRRRPPPRHRPGVPRQPEPPHGGRRAGRCLDAGRLRPGALQRLPVHALGRSLHLHHRPGPRRAADLRGGRQTFEAGRRNYEVTGVWGYGQLAEPSDARVDASGGVDAAQTAVAVDDGRHFAPGQTLLLDSEQALVTAVNANTLTLRRGLNGTSAAPHARGAGVSLLRWPAPVERAALINAARIWTRAPAFEPFYVDADLDTDVRLLLDPYRRTTP